jgi:hypothetical protein
MLNHKSISTFLGIIIIISISACDPYGGYEYWIDNQSDSIIFVSYSEYSLDSIKTKELDKEEMFLLTQFSTHGGLHDDGDNFLDWFDSLGVYIDTAKMIEISRDYIDRDSWDYEQEVTGMMGKAGENIYKLTIRNEDL